MTAKANKTGAGPMLDQLLDAGMLREGMFLYVETFSPAYVGRLVGITPDVIVLSDCVWLVDSGRKGEFVANPSTSYNEAESYGPELVFVQRTSISSFSTLSKLESPLKTK
jgi:hypothetical protein